MTCTWLTKRWSLMNVLPLGRFHSVPVDAKNVPRGKRSSDYISKFLCPIKSIGEQPHWYLLTFDHSHIDTCWLLIMRCRSWDQHDRPHIANLENWPFLSVRFLNFLFLLIFERLKPWSTSFQKSFLQYLVCDFWYLLSFKSYSPFCDKNGPNLTCRRVF